MHIFHSRISKWTINNVDPTIVVKKSKLFLLLPPPLLNTSLLSDSSTNPVSLTDETSHLYYVLSTTYDDNAITIKKSATPLSNTNELKSNRNVNLYATVIVLHAHVLQLWIWYEPITFLCPTLQG